MIQQTAGRNQLGEFAPDFAHYEDSSTEWLEAVSDEEYAKLK